MTDAELIRRLRLQIESLEDSARFWRLKAEGACATTTADMAVAKIVAEWPCEADSRLMLDAERREAQLEAEECRQ